MAAAIKAAAGARMAETELWRNNGDRTPAHMLARRTGESVSKANQQLETAKKLKGRPKTDAAVRGFQEAAQLVVDGIVGPITWNALVNGALAG